MVLFTDIHLRIYGPSMIITLGDFNIDLLKFDSSKHKFIIYLFSDCLQPHIYQPQLGNCGKNKTIINNIFSNIVEPLIKYVATGNIILYLITFNGRFFFLPDFFSNNYSYKKNKNKK